MRVQDMCITTIMIMMIIIIMIESCVFPIVGCDVHVRYCVRIKRKTNKTAR